MKKNLKIFKNKLISKLGRTRIVQKNGEIIATIDGKK